MAKSKSKKADVEEVEVEPPSADVREEAESFKGADPAFDELKRAPEEMPPKHAETVSAHKRILDFLEEFRKATVNIVFAGIVGLLLLTAIKVINADELAIDPISLPKAMKDMGYTEEGVALELSDNMLKIFNDVQLSRHQFNVKAKIDEGDFTVPVAGLSFTSAIRLARQIAGFPQRHISGELLCPSEPCTPANMQLRLRLMDGVHPPQALQPVTGANTDAIVTAGAEKILRVADPISLAVYLYGDTPEQDARRAEASQIANEIAIKGGPDKAIALNILGANASNSGDERGAELAANLFSEAIAIDKAYAPSYSNLASTLAKAGMRKEAIDNFKLALAVNRGVPGVHRQLGMLYSELDRNDEAIAEFKAAIDQDPRDHDALNSWAATLLQMGDDKGAVEKAKAAISIDPTDAYAHFNLGLAYKHLGEKELAKAEFTALAGIAGDTEGHARVKAKAEDQLKALE